MNIANVVSFFLKRRWIIISLCVVTAAGFWCKWYSGLAHKWFNDYGAGLLYEVFWCMAVFFFIPKKKHATCIAISVLVITCILETLQLCRAPVLEQIRSTYLGRLLIGTTFVWWDFPHYLLGCALAWLMMHAISKNNY